MGVNIPTGFAQAGFFGTVTGDAEPVFITIGFDLDGPASVGMADDLFDAWAASLDSLSSTNWSFDGCILKEGPSSTGATFESSAAAVGGLVSQTGTPLNTAILVRKGTSVGGRKGRGRLYTVGQAYESVVGMSGEVDDSHVSDLDDAWLSILGLWQAVTGVVGPVLLHSDSTTPTPITSLNPQKRMATQRRRLRP
jgi:hypothetical protein